ncbi:unnamed protein product [Protopolystoma xenopodis]|uniref:Uncharacterized protein n=1 Tax=Protopolystoma xenopodis TaxID=117903 RepID=A0A448X4E2_9PLAT|nr:unnamed protein product [Protopolystoma xenopodis]
MQSAGDSLQETETVDRRDPGLADRQRGGRQRGVGTETGRSAIVDTALVVLGRSGVQPSAPATVSAAEACG